MSTPKTFPPQWFTPFGGEEFRAPDAPSAGAVVLPLCYENAVSYGTGCREGSLHILKASEQLENLDEETLVEWAAPGVHTLAPVYPAGDAADAVEEMRRAAERVLREGKFLLSLGGDHAVAIGPIQAAAGVCPQIGVLQVDAHMDLRDRWNGSRYNHACVMRRVVEDLGLGAVQVGIRAFCSEELDFARGSSVTAFFAHHLDPADDSWMRKAVDALPDTVYLTVDLDGLDPSVLPGTGTPEPGGLSYRQLVGLIRELGRRRRVLAADITELAPVPGSHVSEFTAARIAAKIFSCCLSPRPTPVKGE